MVTRKEKRAQEKKTNYFFEFAKTKRHFFRDLPAKLKQVQDRRHASYITYSADIILFMMMLKNACDIKTMRSMTQQFNKEETIHNIQQALGTKELEELPHYDTINDFLVKLEPTELENIRTYMVQQLFQKRCFDRYRISGKYWGIIFDGTGLFHFSKKHCEHCLRREWKNEETGEKQVVYMHHVLEAKLVVGDMMLSIGSEFIENESEDVSKQDCELNAFHRLAAKLKTSFPRLPICLLADSLYACEAVFDRCDQYKWKYILRFKEKRIKSIAEEFRTIQEMEGKKEEHLYWVNDLSYHERKVNALEGKETTED